MFCSIKLEEYVESELSGIFWIKVVTKKIVLGSLGTHFMHMRVKGYQEKPYQEKKLEFLRQWERKLKFSSLKENQSKKENY